MMKLGDSSSTVLPAGGFLINVTGTPPILVTTPAPGVRNVAFDCVRDTQANILAMDAAGSLANGGYYTIVDMPAPLTEATFYAMFDVNFGFSKLQQAGNAIDGVGNNYMVGYDIASNFIYYLYQFQRNITATRNALGGVNNIENIQWTSISWIDSIFHDCTINNPTATNVMSSCTLESGAIIDFALLPNCQCINSTFKTGSVVAFTNNFRTIRNSTIGINSTLIMDGLSVVNLTLGDNSSLNLNTFGVNVATIGTNFTITLQASLSSNTIIDGLSDVRLDFDAAANWAATVLTIPAAFNYAGNLRLINNAGGNINKVVAGSTRFPFKFTSNPVIANIFQPTIANVAAADDIVSNSPVAAPIPIAGVAATSDFIEMEVYDQGAGFTINQVLSFVINA